MISPCWPSKLDRAGVEKETSRRVHNQREKEEGVEEKKKRGEEGRFVCLGGPTPVFVAVMGRKLLYTFCTVLKFRVLYNNLQ